MFLEDDDDVLFLYEEDDFDDKAIVAFGDNEIEALIILSYTYSVLFSQTLIMFLYTTEYDIYMWRVVSFNEFYLKILLSLLFLSLFFCLCGLDLVVVLNNKPWKFHQSKKNKKRGALEEEHFGGLKSDSFVD